MSDPTEQRRHETAAEAAARAAQLAVEAAQLAGRAGAVARFVEKVARVGTAVAQEFGLPAIVDTVLDQTILTLEARFACVYLADEQRRMLKLVGHRNLPDDLVRTVTDISFDAATLSARAATTQSPQLVSSLKELDPNLATSREALAWTAGGSMVALPLVARGRLVGVLTFALGAAHEFTTEEQAALVNCAELFAFSVSNATVYEEEHHLRGLFEAVGHATVAIASELELSRTLQGIVDEARDILDAEYAALGIVVAEGRPFDPWVFSGVTNEQARRIGRVPRPAGTLALVASEGRIVRVADVSQHEAFQGLPHGHPSIKSFLGVPVEYQGHAVGNLYLANKRGGNEFTVEDQQALELLAAHAGAAVYQVHLREQIGKERARFRVIVEYAPHGVVFIEKGTEKVLANRRAAELLGRPMPTERPETVDYVPSLLKPDRTPLADDERPARRALREDGVALQELIIQRPDGSEVPVLVSARAVHDEGVAEGVVCVFEDISVLKELQRVREEWAAIVTHDLRQPLNALLIQVNLLQRMATKPDAPLLIRTAERIQRATQNLSRMVGDLADASRLETKRLTLDLGQVDLEALAREVVEVQQSVSHEHHLSVVVEAPIPTIVADPVRIEQVLWNLVENALKYASPGSEVTIEIRLEGNEEQVAVTNHGSGIPPEELPKVFDRYYRTTRARAGAIGGLGLGLYIAKGLVEAHGGRIWADSTLGETTTFRFALPVVRH
jgi:PAS domain S-box-containing protein